MKGDDSLRRREIGNTYVSESDRYIVSLVVGYSDIDLAVADSEPGPEGAAACALSLTRDENAGDTHWYVFDRKAGTMHLFEQDAIDPELGDLREHDDDLPR